MSLEKLGWNKYFEKNFEPYLKEKVSAPQRS